jgi:hypothetical protein
VPQHADGGEDHGGAVSNALPVSVRRLRLTDAELNFTASFHFQLDAATLPAAWPPRPIVALGYERFAR